MLKNVALIGVGVLITVVVFGVVGLAFAQSPNPPFPNPRNGSGMMGGYSGMMGGRRTDGSKTYGPMHEYMEKAMAEALGMTEEEIEEQLAQGKMMWQIAQEKGYTWEQFSELMSTARAAAFKQMVADGVLTQQQADWMLSRMNGMMGRYGQGGGGCPGMGGYGSGRNQAPQTTQPAG